MLNKRKIINDPVFGFIAIPSDLLYDLLQHPYLIRLGRIKQLGLASYVYPGAQHTRLQHSIGAMYLMIEAIKILREKHVEITDKEADAVSAAILLHDIGHGPFSHVLENSFFKDISHETITRYTIEQINKEMGGRLNITLDIIDNNYPKKFLHELVSGQLDMDRLDYLRRDSFFTGVTEGNIGSARIIKMLNIKNDKLVVEAKGIYSIENFLMSRRLMYWQVYLHKTSFGTEKMLSNTIARAQKIAQQDPHLFTTPALCYFLKSQQTNLSEESLHQFMEMDDTDLWVSLKAWCKHNDTVLSELSKGIINRKILKVKISNEAIHATEIENKKLEVSQKLGISKTDANYLVCAGSISNHLYKNDEKSIEILYNNGTTKSIQEASDMFDINVLARKITKYYFCYYRI